MNNNTKELLNLIFSIGNEWYEGMCDYGITSPAELVIKRLPNIKITKG